MTLTSINAPRQVAAAERPAEADRRPVNQIAGHPRLVVRLARVAEAGTEPREEELRLRRRLRLHQPEEGVVLDAGLPEALRRAVVGQLEAQCTFVLLKLPGADLDVEVVALVADLENLRPAEAVDAEAVAEDVQPTAADAHHNVQTGLLLRRVEVNAVHRQLLRIFQVLQLRLLRGEASMLAMEFGHFLLQLRRLVRRKVERAEVVAALVVLAHLVVAQLRLGEEGAENGVRHKGAGNPPGEDVVADLQADQVAGDVLVQLGRVRWVELHLEAEDPGGVYERKKSFFKVRK